MHFGKKLCWNGSSTASLRCLKDAKTHGAYGAKFFRPGCGVAVSDSVLAGWVSGLAG